MALLIARAKWAQKMANAEAMARAARTGSAQHLGATHPLAYFSLATLAVVLRAQGNGAESLALLREASDGVAALGAAGDWLVELFQNDFDALGK